MMRTITIIMVPMRIMETTLIQITNAGSRNQNAANSAQNTGFNVNNANKNTFASDSSRNTAKTGTVGIGIIAELATLNDDNRCRNSEDNVAIVIFTCYHWHHD